MSNMMVDAVLIKDGPYRGKWIVPHRPRGYNETEAGYQCLLNDQACRQEYNQLHFGENR